MHSSGTFLTTHGVTSALSSKDWGYCESTEQNHEALRSTWQKVQRTTPLLSPGGGVRGRSLQSGGSHQEC